MKKSLVCLLIICLVLGIFEGCGETNSGEVLDPGTILANPMEFHGTTEVVDSVVYNENDILIKVTNLSYSNYAAEVEIEIANNSTKEYDFYTGSGYVVINGYTISDGYFSCTVSSGKKAKDTLILSYDDMMILGIYEINSMSIGFDITDDDYNHIYVSPTEVTMATDASNTSDEMSYQNTIRSLQAQNEYGYSMVYFSDDTIYERQNIKIVSQCLLVNQYEDVLLFLEVENNSSAAVNFWIDNVSINNLVIHGAGNWSKDLIWPNTRKVVYLNISNLITNEQRDLFGLQEIACIGMDIELKTIENESIDNRVNTTFTIPGVAAGYDTTGEKLYTGDDVNITFKAIVDGEDYDHDVYIFLLAENKSDRTIILAEEYDTFAVNGYMSGCGMYGVQLEPGQSGVVKIRIYEYMFEDSGITQASDIESFEIEFDINNESYHTLDTFGITYP